MSAGVYTAAMEKGGSGFEYIAQKFPYWAQFLYDIKEYNEGILCAGTYFVPVVIFLLIGSFFYFKTNNNEEGEWMAKLAAFGGKLLALFLFAWLTYVVFITLAVLGTALIVKILM